MMQIIDARPRLDEFLVNQIPTGIMIRRLPGSGIGDYSLIGKTVGEKPWKFLWWSGINREEEPLCEVIYPDVVRVVDSSVIQQLTPLIEKFERESGRAITVVKKDRWQRFS